jgi:hypothetical protein
MSRDPFDIEDPEGVLHILGRIDDDADWTQCGREFISVAGWTGRLPQDLRSPHCENSLRFLRCHISLIEDDLALIAANAGWSLDEVDAAFEGRWTGNGSDGSGRH